MRRFVISLSLFPLEKLEFLLLKAKDEGYLISSESISQSHLFGEVLCWTERIDLTEEEESLFLSHTFQ